MKRGILLISSVLLLASCSNNSGGGNSSPNPAEPRPDGNQETGQNNKPPQNPTELPSQPVKPSAPVLPREDIGIVKGILGTKISEANGFITKALTLTSKLAQFGASTTLENCKTVQGKISANYHLHFYSEAGDNTQHQGIQICPEEIKGGIGDMAIFKGEWIYPATFKFYTNSNSGVTQLGLPFAGVMTVEYRLYSYPTKVIGQYFYDKNFKFVEFISSRQEKQSDGSYKEFFVEVASMAKEGHVLGNVFKLWQDPTQKYLWKKSTSFVPVDGQGVTASTYIQNDGSGREVAISNYRIPDNWTWQDYEVSPATRVWGIYSINGKLYGWPEKQYSYSAFNGPTQCEEGSQGYDSSGNYIRVFGDGDCSKKLDVQTTAH